MAAKNKPNAENNAAQNTTASNESWRKPLQVPPRADAMRSFYKSEEEREDSNSLIKHENRQAKSAMPAKEDPQQPAKTDPVKIVQLESKKTERQENEPEPETKRVVNQDNEGAAPQANAKDAGKLTEKSLSERLGFEIDELFDVHELLRGKSFDIYQTLLGSCDESGRCKITQPELMKRTGIKNRRTFYKHEEWLINLRLLEKRHLPGDHKGVVYRVFEMSDVLPIANEMLQKFNNRLRNIG
jgi:hypothetical protein